MRRTKEGISIVISFSVPDARNQLLNEGSVYTFRWRRRKFFEKEKGEIEKTWANKGRGNPKLVDVDIHEIGKFDPWEAAENTKYLANSGFPTTLEWIYKIEDMRPPYGFVEGWLYKVSQNSQQLRTRDGNPTLEPKAAKHKENRGVSDQYKEE